MSLTNWLQNHPLITMTTTTEQTKAAAVVAIAKAAANYPQITELWQTEDERYEYARNCVAEAIEFDKLTHQQIIDDADAVIKRDLDFA